MYGDLVKGYANSRKRFNLTCVLVCGVIAAAVVMYARTFPCDLQSAHNCTEHDSQRTTAEADYMRLAEKYQQQYKLRRLYTMAIDKNKSQTVRFEGVIVHISSMGDSVTIRPIKASKPEAIVLLKPNLHPWECLKDGDEIIAEGTLGSIDELGVRIDNAVIYTRFYIDRCGRFGPYTDPTKILKPGVN